MGADLPGSNLDRKENDNIGSNVLINNFTMPETLNVIVSQLGKQWYTLLAAQDT